MLGEITAFLEFLLDAARTSGLFDKATKRDSKKSLLRLHTLLNDIITDSDAFLVWADRWLATSGHAVLPMFDDPIARQMRHVDRNPKLPDGMWEGSIIMTNTRHLWEVARKSYAFWKELDRLRDKLDIYIPQLPHDLDLCMNRKFSLMYFWFEAPGFTDKSNKTSFRRLLRRLSGKTRALRSEDQRLAFLVGGNCLFSDECDGDADGDARRSVAARLVREGRRNIAIMVRLKEELRVFICTRFDVRDVFNT